ncbi:B-cell scaffold protein with ankyrin repeats, partial [Chelonia mydas]
DSTTYTTLRHSIPSGQEELILLQEKVKKGTITVDEALEKFKQWQNEKSSLEVTQQEKVRQLRDSIIGKRPEEEILYDKITIEHHPNGKPVPKTIHRIHIQDVRNPRRTSFNLPCLKPGAFSLQMLPSVN